MTTAEATAPQAAVPIPETAAVAGAPATEATSSFRKWYALAILTLIYSVHFLDRTMISLVIEPVRREFHLSDSQIGLLTGLAYGLTFAVVGIPLGLLIDRVKRVRLLALLVLIWSGMTALCGTAGSFLSLLLARVGVGAAESGGSPASLSLIADYFPPQKRSTATGIFFLSMAIGAFASIFIGGVVTAKYGWRASMLLASVPGAILALTLFLTVREPRRGTFDPVVAVKEKSPGLRQVLAYLRGRKVVIHLIIGFSLNSGGVAAVGSWMTSFLMRFHGLNVREAGLSTALVMGVFASVGSMLGGLISDRIAKTQPRRRMQLAATASAVAMAMGGAAMFMPSLPLFLLCLTISHTMAFAVFPALFGALLGLVNARMRGTTAAAVQVVSNLVGYGMGPFLVGILSDYYGGPQSLRYALFTTVIFAYGWAALHLVLSARAAKREGALLTE